jgi:hypothetical protein
MNLNLETQELRKRVSELEAQVHFLFKRLGVTFVAGAFELDPADGEVAEWLKKGDALKVAATYRSLLLQENANDNQLGS